MYLNLRIVFNTDQVNPLCGIHSNNSVCIYPLVGVIQNVNSALGRQSCSSYGAARVQRTNADCNFLLNVTSTKPHYPYIEISGNNHFPDTCKLENQGLSASKHYVTYM